MLMDETEKKNLIIQKDSKQKKIVKRTGIKIKIQNKYYHWLEGEIKKKII